MMRPSNAGKSLFVMALTMARFSSAPDDGPTRRYYQHINKFSAAFAFATDMAMLTLGGYLKQKEHLSARLGDVLTASAHEISKGGRSGVYDIDVHNQRGEHVAAFRGRSFTMKGKPLVEGLPVGKQRDGVAR